MDAASPTSPEMRSHSPAGRPDRCRDAASNGDAQLSPLQGLAGMLGFMTAPVDLDAIFATIAEPWSPRTVAVMNDYDIRIVRTQGEFTWHSHPEADEFFLVMMGSLTSSLY